MSDETKSAVIGTSPAEASDTTTPATPAEATLTAGRAASVTDGAPSAVEASTAEQSSASVADAPDQEPGTLPANEANTSAEAAGEPAAATDSEPATVAPDPSGSNTSVDDADGAEPEAQTATAEADDAHTTATAAGEPAQEPASGPADDAKDKGEVDEDGQPVVRLLSVGQEVQGVVKRISEFGAFVDIGVGRDGLVHISELSPRRIAKVTDVLQEGMEATFWIKKLDRERNRISLTMIEPGTKTIRNMDKGDIVQGNVTRIMPYGAFIDIGIGRDALLHVREMGERYIAKPEDVVQVGESIEARIIDISRRRARVDLSIKGLRPEPEPEPQQATEQQNVAEQAQEAEPEVVDNFADTEVLSPFAAALRRAEEASGVRVGSNKSNKKKKRQRNHELDEEIFERTLNSGRK